MKVKVKAMVAAAALFAFGPIMHAQAQKHPIPRPGQKNGHYAITVV